MNDKLLIASKYKKTNEYILNITNNYPHKYLELKGRIINISFDILELIYMANMQISSKISIIPKIKMLDYYMKLSYDYNIITKKKYTIISNNLLELLKMLYEWSDEKKE